MFFRHIVQQVVHGAAEKGMRARAEEQARVDLRRRASCGELTLEDEPLPNCDVLLVFALSIESGEFVDLLEEPVVTRCPHFTEYAATFGEQDIVLIETGAGSEAAAAAVRHAIAIFHPAWVVSAGFAGGLIEELERGHMLMANHLAGESGGQFGTGLSLDEETLRASPGLHTGKLLTVDRIIREPEEKRRLAKQFDAVACDMETFAIAEACSHSKTRLISVRVISDSVNDVLPAEVEKLMTQKTLAAKLGAAAGAIFQRPSSVKDMWALKEQANKAAERLAKFLPGVLSQLH